MAYVLLNNAGQVTAYSAFPISVHGAIEVADNDARVVAYLSGQTPAQLQAYAQNKRESVALGGISVNVAASGQPAQMIEVATDTAGCLNVAGAVQLATINPAQTFNWVQGNSSVALNAAQIAAIGQALGAFIQSTYTILGEVLAAISAGTITTTAAIDAAGWPANS